MTFTSPIDYVSFSNYFAFPEERKTKTHQQHHNRIFFFFLSKTKLNFAREMLAFLVPCVHLMHTDVAVTGPGAVTSRKDSDSQEVGHCNNQRGLKYSEIKGSFPSKRKYWILFTL